MSPYIANIGLTPIEKAKLFASGVIRMREDLRPVTPDDYFTEKIGPSNYGRTKRVAERYVAGEFGDQTVYDVALAERLAPESLKSQIWKVRNNYTDKPRRKLA